MGIELQKVKRSGNLAEWAEMVRACKNSGLTVKNWCLEQGLKEKTYYYRQRQICNVLPAQMSSPVQFAEVSQPKMSMVTEGEIRIHIGAAEIRVDSHTDLALLQNVLHIVTETC